MIFNIFYSADFLRQVPNAQTQKRIQRFSKNTMEKCLTHSILIAKQFLASLLIIFNHIFDIYDLSVMAV